MTRGQERADEVPRTVEGQRVRARFRGNRLVPTEVHRVEDVDAAGLADRHVKATPRRIVEHNVRDAGDRLGTEDRATVRMDLEQEPGITGAEQAAPCDIEVQAVWPGVGHRDDAPNPDWIAGLDDD